MNATDADQRLTNLFEDHYDEVLAYCTRRIGATDAADVAAEVFAAAWRKIDEIDWDTARPWLYGVARGVLANRWRSLRRKGRLYQKMSAMRPSDHDAPEVYVLRREQDEEVIRALRRLRDSDQEILRLAAWEELTASEIATLLGVTTAAAEQRIHRAKARLARVLKPIPDGHDNFSPRAAEEGGGS